jgi:hypothetical protein
MKAILLLGKAQEIYNFFRENNMDYSDMEACTFPGEQTHYTYYNEIIASINYIISKRKENEEDYFFTTQNKEFIELLLHSDLNFDVWTVFDARNNVVRKVSKDEAYKCQYSLGLDLRG